MQDSTAGNSPGRSNLQEIQEFSIGLRLNVCIEHENPVGRNLKISPVSSQVATMSTIAVNNGDATSETELPAETVSNPVRSAGATPTTSNGVPESITSTGTFSTPPGSIDSCPTIPPGEDIATKAGICTTEDDTSAQHDHPTATSAFSPPSFSPPVGFADLVASACYAQFSKLPRRARPQAGREWALLAGVLLSVPPHKQPVVVALGTGSKCLGASQLSATGEKLADSHAEVVTRRAFRRFLMSEVRKVYKDGGESQWLEKRESGAMLREDVRVHFFTSHTPCGDCSIFPRDDWETAETGAEPVMKKPREGCRYSDKGWY